MSTYNSSEDIATTLASPGVDGIQGLGMLASPLFTKKKGKCSSMKELSLYQNSASTFITFSIQYRETSGDVLTQEKVKSRSKKFTAVLSIEKSSIFLNYKQIMPPKEKRQIYQNSLKV